MQISVQFLFSQLKLAFKNPVPNTETRMWVLYQLLPPVLNNLKPPCFIFPVVTSSTCYFLVLSSSLS